MRKKEIFDICDQLGITYQAQAGGLNESLFYKDFILVVLTSSETSILSI